MFLVEHFVGKSRIHGLGVFISKPIKRRSLIWKFDPDFDIEISCHLVSSLSKHDMQFILNHAEYISETDSFRLGNDGDIFMNHSDTPSLSDYGDFMLAARDLRAGDELTCDYRTVRVLGFDEQCRGSSKAFAA